jgi:hypothetical protein
MPGGLACTALRGDGPKLKLLEAAARFRDLAAHSPNRTPDEDSYAVKVTEGQEYCEDVLRWVECVLIRDHKEPTVLHRREQELQHRVQRGEPILLPQPAGAPR